MAMAPDTGKKSQIFGNHRFIVITPTNFYQSKPEYVVASVKIIF